MEKSELEKLSKEELIKKEKGLKSFILLFILLIIALLFFNIKDYLDGNSVDGPIGIITLCSFGGMLSLFPGLKSIRAELKKRNTHN